MNWDDLTELQQEAASSTVPRLVVFGEAGSGKTTVALWCARHFLESSAAVDHQRVLFLTFSRTAVREISRRSGRALLGIRDRVEIQTFHSFAHRIVSSFGRYAGLGCSAPTFQSEAQTKLFGKEPNQIRYDDLLPLALEIMGGSRISRLLTARWPLVICDEFQDTGDHQWELLGKLSADGRLVLLADPNQMIYGFLRDRGVGPQRVRQAQELADRVIDLGTRSHRDTTNVIPAMAQAIRQRRFDDAAVTIALRKDRLRIYPAVPDSDLIETLRDEILASRRQGAKTIGVFGHGNEPVAALSAELMATGLDHILIGLPEAHGEALLAMETLCLHGLGRCGTEEVRMRLAVFLTASVRGKAAPPLAVALAGGGALRERLVERIELASQALKKSAGEGIEELIRTTMEVWPNLGITAGRRPWAQAARTFGATAQQILTRAQGRTEEFLVGLSRRVAGQRTETCLDLDVGSGHPLQLMNFHQTKGREADVVILVYRDDDWFGHEDEPFPENSRLLYVSLTRARNRVVIVLPLNSPPLVAPFGALITS